MPFPPDEAKLVSIFVQSVLYGVYARLFFETVSVIVRRPSSRPFRRSSIAICFLLFIIATTHVSVNFTRIIKAFIIHRDEPGGPAAFFNELSEFTQMFGSTLYVAQTLLGDALALLRCYLVWEHKLYIIAFPLVLLAGSIATGIGILYYFDKVVPQADIFVTQLSHWITAFFSTTFVTNVICTALVAYRLYLLNRGRPGFRQRKLAPVLVLMVESGAYYSLTLLLLLILYNVDSWFQYVVLDAVSPIVGIVFTTIILRIASGLSTEEGETQLLPGDTAGGIGLDRMPSRERNSNDMHKDSGIEDAV
ncbi:hypothetical protein R3P38DRAFT_2935085 [Favolaschia claudopus]|uniref:Uncharacterized protein n=1 Tax=Favolaschia claudopus TaxID=2862362 RepID=A0AAW0BNV7_9AGAR